MQLVIKARCPGPVAGSAWQGAVVGVLHCCSTAVLLQAVSALRALSPGMATNLVESQATAEPSAIASIQIGL